MFNIKRTLRPFSIGLIAFSLSLMTGCAAIHTSIAKRNLDVQTKVSTAIFVDAVKKSKRTVYVDIRSSVMEFDRSKLKRAVLAAFASNDNGYRVTDDPDEAQYLMNIFVLKLEKASPTAVKAALQEGYSSGGADSAIAAGAILGSRRGKGAEGAVLLGLGATVANAFVQDVTYMLVADVQIKEKTRKGVYVRKDTKINTKVSDSGGSTQRVSEVSNRKEYRTRIVTTANKVNLDMAEAEPLMFKKTAYAMSGFF